MIYKLFNLFTHQYTIQELKTFMENNAETVQKNIPTNCKILIIDDMIETSDYPEIFTNDIAYLKNQMNYNITTKKDLEYVTDVLGYDIIICDHEGIGFKILGKRGNGIQLIKELKKTYPHKVFVLYSSVTFNLSAFNRIKKDVLVWDKTEMIHNSVEFGEDGLVDNIQKAMRIYADPTKYWTEVRNKMIDADISIHEIAKLESSYVKSILKKNASIYSETVKKTSIPTGNGKSPISDYIQAATSVINTTLSLLSIL